MAIADSKKGTIYLYCPGKHCSEREIVEAMGLTIADLMADFVLPPIHDKQRSQQSQNSRKDSSSIFVSNNGSLRNSRNSRKENFETENITDSLPLTPTKPKAIQFPETSLDQYIRAVQGRTQAPYILCAQSVLAAATLSVQHLADIELPGIGGPSSRRPISNFFLTVARSGERKSSADRIALEGIEARRIVLEKGFSQEKSLHKLAQYNYEQREKTAFASGSLQDLGEAPEPPHEPILLVKEPTQEGLFRSLQRGQPSQGLFNDEGGAFLGGYGMSADHRMKTASTLNALWDGATIDRPRAKEHEVLRGRRFCLHLMMQPMASE